MKVHPYNRVHNDNASRKPTCRFLHPPRSTTARTQSEYTSSGRSRQGSRVINAAARKGLKWLPFACGGTWLISNGMVVLWYTFSDHQRRTKGSYIRFYWFGGHKRSTSFPSQIFLAKTMHPACQQTTHAFGERKRYKRQIHLLDTPLSRLILLWYGLFYYQGN